LFVVELHILWN